MIRIVNNIFLICFLMVSHLYAQKSNVYPGADEKTPSRAQYSTWINNTNEGPTEKQTLINLDFFEWLNKEYGMVLDIYAFDAGLIDGAGFYGSMKSARFAHKFPTGLNNIYIKAKSMNTQFGSWGGPDGFGDTPESAAERKDMMISLCRDYEWALFKVDAVSGLLRKEKQNDFVDMMQKCRSYSPDLILLNHRLDLGTGMPYATTFLWEGIETYIDIHTSNTTTAPHNRAGALARGLVPGLVRLTEDCGVCLSSCLDYWDDDLILQAFNRNLILAPEIYGNPWLLSDSEFPKLARIYNLHRKFGKILVDGMVLPDSYGSFPVSRGDTKNRLITLRNLEWEPKEQVIKLNEEIGLMKGNSVTVRMFHPVERIMGTYRYGETVKVNISPFRSVLLFVSTGGNEYDEPAVKGVDFEVVKNIPRQPVEIKLLGLPGTTAEISLPKGKTAKKVWIDGKEIPEIVKGKSINIQFEGDLLKYPYHRKLTDMKKTDISVDAASLYEATVFAADNNALEVRSLQRSGKTNIPAVQAARAAFFNQTVFINKGVWDKNLFDGNMKTGFWPTRRYGIDKRVMNGCFRLDLGQTMYVDSVIFRMNDEYEMQPLLFDEGKFANISSDLKQWKSILFLASTKINLTVKESFRYLKMNPFPDALYEIEVYANGRKMDASDFRVSNLFADSRQLRCEAIWYGSFTLDELADNSYLSVALNGEHGVEGAYAALKVDGQLVGAPSRAVSYPSNAWEWINSTSSSNYTYYFPLNNSMKNKKIEVFVMGYDKEHLNFAPEVWLCAYPVPYKEKQMTIVTE